MLKRNIGKVVALALVFAFVLSLSSVCFAADRTPLQILDHHIQSMFAGDLDAVMSDYADDVVSMNTFSDTPIIGKTALREVIKKMVPTFMKSLNLGSSSLASNIPFQRKDCVGNYLYVKMGMNPIMHMTETWICQNDKIILVTAAFYWGSGRDMKF